MPDDNNQQPVAYDEAAVTEKVLEVIAESLELEVEEVKMEASFFDLGAESLDLLDMAFMLEKEFQIQFPRTDILERATQHFGEEALVVDGVITPLGLEMLQRGMPELDPGKIKPGLRDIDVAQMITVESFVRITHRLLDAKANFSRTCAACGGALKESDFMPEFTCAECGEIYPLPSGDDILLEDLLTLARDAGWE